MSVITYVCIDCGGDDAPCILVQVCGLSTDSPPTFCPNNGIAKWYKPTSNTMESAKPDVQQPQKRN